MTLYSPLHAQNLSYSATLDRQLIDAVYGSPGVVASTDLAVTQRGAGANMSVDVASGKVVVTGSDAAGQGKYLCWSDATTNVTIATAPGVGNSRIDLIVAQVRDADQNGGANNDWVIVAVTGTAGASPSAPAAPASSVVLAQIAVAASVTSIVNANITDKRPTAGIFPGGASVSFPPAWTSSGTAPALGNGTLTGKYLRTGKFCHVSIYLLAGSTTTFGTGAWLLSLPFPSASGRVQFLPGMAYDGTHGYPLGAPVAAGATNTSQGILGSSSGATVGAASPFTWASGYWLVLEGTYEVA